MTYEEAYKILTEHTRNYVPHYDSEALEVAIKAVKKQVTGNTARWEINPDGYYPQCSNCGEEGEITEYCPHCGYRMISISK